MKLKYAIIVTIFFVLMSCTSSTDSSLEKSVTQNYIQSDGVLYTLKIRQASFTIDDSLKVKFEVKNISIMKKNFNFNIQQQFCFKLTDQFNQVAMSYPRIVQPANSRFTLSPGKTKIFTFSGQFKNQEGNYIDKGKYRLSTSLLGNYPKVKLNILIK
jgi:hypothetical protein